MNTLSADIKKVIGGDEYYSPQNVVDMIVPFANFKQTERSE